MKKLLSPKDWIIDVNTANNTVAIGMFTENNVIVWVHIDASALPNDLIRLKDGKGIVVVGGVEVEATSCCNSLAASGRNANGTCNTMD